MTTRQIRALARERKNCLIEEKFVKNSKDFSAFIKQIKNTDMAGKKILQNFIEHFVVPYHSKKGKHFDCE